MKKTAIIVLNYNGYVDTASCVISLLSIGVDDTAIFVVDNNSTDHSFSQLNSQFPNVHILQSGRNGGYAFGNNVGIAAAMRDGFQKVCVMNPDVTFNYNFIEPIIRTMNSDTSIGIAAPCVRYTSGEIQSEGGKINLWTGRSIFNKTGSNYENVGLVDADYVSGGCLIITREAIERAGLIPEQYFLNFEDNEWCLQVKKSGLRVVCDTSAFVFHDGEASIGKISGLQKYFLYRNRVLFEKRNASWLQKAFFYPFVVISGIRRLIVFRDSSVLKAYVDGIRGRNKYSYLQE
jgi:GT2 family glycosyltransferase